MPILNIQVKVENNKIVYKWFRKEMSNYLLLLANSAMPDRTKRECLVQYAMTILLNTSRQLPWEVVADTLSEFSHRMLVSGYNSIINFYHLWKIFSFSSILQTEFVYKIIQNTGNQKKLVIKRGFKCNQQVQIS